MRFHAILFMCDDIKRAEWVSTNFKHHNPDAFLTVYNGGVDDQEVRARLDVDHYEAGENLWHTKTRAAPGSFGYGWFEKFFEHARSRDADYTIYLETAVEVRRAIASPPKWDISGPLNGADTAAGLIAYDFWGSHLQRGPFVEHLEPTPNKLHTGCGGTAFSRNFFMRSRSNLRLVKAAFEQIPYVFYADLMVTLLGRHSGCSFGDWCDVSNAGGSYRFDESTKRIVREPSIADTSMVHGVKI